MVVPARVREAMAAHAEAERPNEACGLVLLRGGEVVGYEPARNVKPSPYFFELEFDPVRWMDLWDEGYEIGIFHSHLESPARPSKTDVENIGEWQGLPYFVLSLRSGELGAFRIRDGRIEQEPVTEDAAAA